MIREISDALGGVSDLVVYALLLLAVVQLGVQIWALVDLTRRDNVAGGRKWVWAAVILLLSNLALGAILYFLVGRTKNQTMVDADVPQIQSGDRTARAVDALYGPSDGSDAR